MLARTLLSLALVLPMPLGATPDTPGMTITGDQELPKVLYVTPWQTPKPLQLPPPQLENPTRQPLSPCQLGDAGKIAHWPCDPPAQAVTGDGKP